MKKILLSAVALSLILITSCKDDEIEPLIIDEKEVTEQLLMGKWDFVKSVSTSCHKETNDCVTINVDLVEDAFMTFTADSLFMNSFGYTQNFLLDLINKDTLYLDNAFPSKYMMIKFISNDSLALEYNMDVEHPNVNPDYAIIDYYYLKK